MILVKQVSIKPGVILRVLISFSKTSKNSNKIKRQYKKRNRVKLLKNYYLTRSQVIMFTWLKTHPLFFRLLMMSSAVFPIKNRLVIISCSITSAPHKLVLIVCIMKACSKKHYVLMSFKEPRSEERVSGSVSHI